MPQAFKPAIESTFNRQTWPRVRDIEPPFMQQRPAGQRYFGSTSAAAKWLGEELNISPLKADHLMLGYFGRAIGPLIGKPGAWDRILNPYLRQVYLTSGRQVQDFYEYAGAIQTAHADKNKNRAEYAPEDAKRIDVLYRHVTRGTDALSDYRKLGDPHTPEGNKLRGRILEEVAYVNGDIDANGMPKPTKRMKPGEGTSASRPSGQPWTMPSI
jgi:hypothetical protein